MSDHRRITNDKANRAKLWSNSSLRSAALLTASTSDDKTDCKLDVAGFAFDSQVLLC
ncbi:uncharacterized protein J3R85_014715 [Psidium guajava]|nr:uncharacterized protein J3R85_014715 [Psidium guajava]